MLLLGLKAMGVSTIYMTEVMEYRRKKAEELGASLVWNPLRSRPRPGLRN
jgi:threonine dehydrogenase-like Zn-dependent dehydrogenase